MMIEETRNKTVLEQATRLERLLPKLMRRLFTLDPQLITSELPLAQLRVCVMLQCGPRMLTTLSEELGTSLSAVTQIADRLERAGFVERVPETDDRRTKKLQLTPYGADLMRARRERRVQRVADALKHLDSEEREAIIAAFQTLMGATPAPTPESAEDPVAAARLEQ